MTETNDRPKTEQERMTETDGKVAIDDRLLQQFFAAARQKEIADDGFTERVIERLPDRALRQSYVWTACCVVLGLVLFVAFQGWQPLALGLLSMTRMLVAEVRPVPFFMTAGVLSCLALLAFVQRFERMLA